MRLRSRDLIAILIGVMLARAAHAIDSRHAAARREWAAISQRMRNKTATKEST